MSTPEKVLNLVEVFERNADEYLSAHFNEAMLRQQFVNPFFKCLGWDMDNEQGYAEAFKEVIHEAAIKIGGATKAPDYSFRIGGRPIFYLEAKKPAVNLKDDPAPAFQLRRYGWTARMPLSILTNFNEFAVYDCRIKPAQTDKASTARVLYLRCADYAAAWDEKIAGVFSRDAVLKGYFDKFTDSKKVKRGTATVDAAILDEIESWREELAKNLALRNPELSSRELNFAVQITIDRVIFLRMCEDRGIEPYGQLKNLLDHADVYDNLRDLYRKADERYNSGLFHFHKEKDRPESPDELTPRLKIDDKVLKSILRGLYYPESPYEFSVLPVEILGQVYEQFLGKVIRLTAAHQAKVEEKPEVKKAGGVYYTPSYIVDYIVQHTVGRLLDGKTPKEAARLTVLDPACGSGSFLLGAYRSLLEWHLKQYTEAGPEKHKKEIFQAAGGVWRLTTAEKKRILLNNIYGVDIDPQAVEVTKLSLLLKVLEGESQETLDNQFKLFHERALPDLAGNIKCGNSLIGPDFYEGRQTALFDEEDIYRINVFDWGKAFPKIMKAGGFDAAIGNPPYVRQESLAAYKEYFSKHYEAFDSVADLYAYFMEKGVKLLRDGGLFSIIVSSSFLRATYGEPLRRTLKKYAAVLRIVDFGGLAVFANAKDTYVCIPLLAKSASHQRAEVSKVDSLEIRNVSEHAAANFFTIPHERLSPEAWALKSDEETGVFDKIMKGGKPLGEYVERKFFSGLKTGLNEAFEVSLAQAQALIDASPASKVLIKPFLGGQDIRRYSIKDDGRHFIVIPCGWTRQQMAKAAKGLSEYTERDAGTWLSQEHPGIAAHLTPFMVSLRKRQDQGEFWWELRSCDYYEYLDREKIVFPDICKGPRFHLDRSGIYLANTAYCLIGDLYLLGVLNSRLFWFAIGNISIPFGVRAGQYRYRLIYQYMEKVPIRVIDFSNAADKTRHDRMVQLVEQMLALHKQLASAKAPHDKTVFQAQIDATDRQIDRLVYDLYGLTEEEIRIVEPAGN